MARRGDARQGLQTAVRRASAFPTALSGADVVWSGQQRSVMARSGEAMLV